ncbi:MAG: hypothetical protein JXP73_04395 [Deltaproteobacteria bacterium]|nr:hypothetical protein [Deltaproteobacteria bacterium]
MDEVLRNKRAEVLAVIARHGARNPSLFGSLVRDLPRLEAAVGGLLGAR